MHLVLAVSDVDRAYAFYRGVFGWESHIGWPGEYEELVVTEDDRLGLYRRDGWAASAGAEPADLNGHVSPAYLYVRVDDLAGTIARLPAAGPPPPRAAGRQARARSRRISTATSPPRPCTSASTTSTGRSSASARPEPARSALEPPGTGATRPRTSPTRTETSSRSPHD